MVDPYEVLGIQRGASHDDVRTAYRNAVKGCHTDLFPADQIREQRFREVNAAYEVLGDKDKRALYDKYGEACLTRGFQPSNGDTGWKEYAHRWETVRPSKSSSYGVVLSEAQATEDMYEIVCRLKARVKDTINARNFGETLQGIIDELMEIYDNRSVHLKQPRKIYWHRSHYQNLLDSIPLDCARMIYGAHEPEYLKFDGGLEILTELLEQRLEPDEVTSLTDISERLGRADHTWPEVATSALDLYIDRLLQAETKEYRPINFKKVDWNSKVREIVDKHVDHYRILRCSLADRLDIDVRDAETRLARGYFMEAINFGNNLNREGQKTIEDAFMASVAITLMDRSISMDDSLVIPGYAGSDLLTSFLAGAKDELISRVQAKKPSHYSRTASKDKADLLLCIKAIKKMANVAGTKEAKEVANNTRIAAGVGYLSYLIL